MSQASRPRPRKRAVCRAGRRWCRRSADPPTQHALADGFIDQTFMNLFGRAATISDVALWRTAFFGGLTPSPPWSTDRDGGAGRRHRGDERQDPGGLVLHDSRSAQLEPPSLAEMQAAVSDVTDAHDVLASDRRDRRPRRLGTRPGRLPDDPVADRHHHRRTRRLHGSVILTGSQGTTAPPTRRPSSTRAR